MSNKILNILFLGGAKRVSMAEKFINEGLTRGISVNIFSYELDKNVPINIVAEIIVGLKWNDKNIYTDLLKVSLINKINIIIPFLDLSTLIAARLKDMIEFKNIFIPVSNEENCNLFFDKHLANQWCIDNKVNVPASINNYPLIAKPINGSASKGLIIIQNSEELKNLKNKKKYLVQKFIEGNEYSVDIYRSTINNEIISIVPRIRLETQGGESIKSITVKDQSIIDYSRKIIEKTNLVGPITLQFIQDRKTKVLYYMEINPRFGGAVLNSIFAGANSPAYLLNEYYKIKNNKNENWTDNFLMLRRFSENYKICK
jgi:carbamoyl-phosphate synthase large subunit